VGINHHSFNNQQNKYFDKLNLNNKWLIHLLSAFISGYVASQRWVDKGVKGVVKEREFWISCGEGLFKELEGNRAQKLDMIKQEMLSPEENDN